MRARASALLLACIGVALALGAAGPSAARSAGAAPSFAVAKNFAVGRTPGLVSIADLNGDHSPDVVTTDSLGSVANTVSVLLNRGDGTLGPSVEYRMGRHPQQTKIRDLNGDGKPDVAVVSCNSGRCHVSIRINRGDGTFAGPHGYAVGWLTVADLNADHRPELVTVLWTAASGSSRAVSVLTNKGDGTFESKVDYPVGKANGVSAGDLNGDGAPDLAVENAKASRISVLLNKGDGTFLPRRDYVTRRGPSWVSIADLNGDGRRDVLTGSCRSVSVLLNRGGGVLRRTLDSRLGVCGDLLALADVNGDERPDVVVDTPWTGKIVVLLNRGDGTFGARRRYALEGCVYAEIACGQLAVRDVNGDRRPDLVAASGWEGNAVYVRLNRGNGTFAQKVGYRSDGRPTAFAVADLNRDGRRDLVTANYGSKSVGVLLNKPGLCTVQDVKGNTLPIARQTLARVHCRIGKTSRAYSRVRAGRVISQKPTFGAVLPKGGEVNLVVSRGPRR